jgi:hypothetical protein
MKNMMSKSLESKVLLFGSHQNTDEFFYTLSGSSNLKSKTRKALKTCYWGPESYLPFPRVYGHRPVGNAGILLIEKRGVVNTGDTQNSSMTRVVEDARAIKQDSTSFESCDAT